MTQSVDEKYNLITRCLQEVIGSPDHIKGILEKRPMKIYWGTAPTGTIHLGYFVPLLKIADFLKAGCEVTILIADLHAFLDNMKSTLKQLALRAQYYETMIKAVLTTLNIDISKLKFIKGTDFQLIPEYTMDVYKLNANTTVNQAKHAGAEVVKQSDNPPMTGLLYPGLQALDVQYLDVDATIGGIDQRKIYTFANEKLPKLKYKKRIHLMNEMVPGLRIKKKEENTITPEVDFDKLKGSVQNIINKANNVDELYDLLNQSEKFINNNTENIQLEKMSASNKDSKIDLLDGKGQVKKKINRAYCFPGYVDDNTPLVLLEKILFPVLQHLDKQFVIIRKEEFGGSIVYSDFNKVNDDFKAEKLHPGDLKSGIIDALNFILDPIRQQFASKEMTKLVREAYK
jgi:tyrosyl-tRNA synthetase